MAAIRRIKELLGLTPTPIRHNHVYTDTITGERFIVNSVGRSVAIERLDAKRRPESSVRKSTLRKCISSGVVTHDGSKKSVLGENNV